MACSKIIVKNMLPAVCAGSISDIGPHPELAHQHQLSGSGSNLRICRFPIEMEFDNPSGIADQIIMKRSGALIHQTVNFLCVPKRGILLLVFILLSLRYACIESFIHLLEQYLPAERIQDRKSDGCDGIDQLFITGIITVRPGGCGILEESGALQQQGCTAEFFRDIWIGYIVVKIFQRQRKIISILAQAFRMWENI